jgi:CHAT domain-containing protein
LQVLAPAVAEMNRPWVEAQLQPVLIADLQKKLRPDELLLEYVLDDPVSFCIVLSQDRARLQKLPSGVDITRQSDALIAAIQNRAPFATSARQLYSSLLAPIEESRTKSNLIVVPDGALHRLPLEVLIDSTGKKLLDAHVVSYVPSSSVLALLRRPRRPVIDSLPLLAVSASPAATEQASNLGRIQRGVFDLDDMRLPPLPGANDEVKSVAQTLGNGSIVLVGQQASEGKIKAQPLDRFRVLHFAVHGLLSTTYPERSALILQADAASGDDGLLQAREISQLRLNADLVTLSACDTGNGKIKGQEGVSALIRPFLVAGAQSVVANLWQADDEFTLALMREFYRRLSAGSNIATAMRDAKRDLIKTFGTEAPPALWAGFIVIGEGANSVTTTGGARP